MSYAIYILSGQVFFIKRNRLTHTRPKTRGPSKSQKHAWRTKQVSQFTLRKCWAGSGTYLSFIKYKMKQTLILNNEFKMVLISSWSPVCLLRFWSFSSLYDYSLLYFYQYLRNVPPCMIIPSCMIIWYLRVCKVLQKV